MDVHAYLCLAVGRDELANLNRIVNKPSRYVSREAIASVGKCMKGEMQKKTVLERLMEYYSSRDERIVENLKILHNHLSKIKRLSPYTAVQYVRKVMRYEAFIAECFHNSLERKDEAMEMLEWLTEEAKEQEDLFEWIGQFQKAEQTLASDSQNLNGKITLMTIHGAKGLEFDYVILPDVNERNYPHGVLLDQKALEEERRIFYVGMTRAKKELQLLYVENKGGDGEMPSRFLKEFMKTDKNAH